MKDAIIGKHHEAGAPLSGSSLLYLFVVFCAAVVGLMLGISFQLNWTECLVSTFTAAMLAFFLAFTIVEMRKIGGQDASHEGRYTYTMTFAKDALPPVDRPRGGFWSLTMCDKDFFMLPNSPNGRINIGTMNLAANELKFAADGSLTITTSHDEPPDAVARANWRPAPEGQFAMIVRAHVPPDPILKGSYNLPDVQHVGRAWSASSSSPQR